MPPTAHVCRPGSVGWRGSGRPARGPGVRAMPPATPPSCGAERRRCLGSRGALQAHACGRKQPALHGRQLTMAPSGGRAGPPAMPTARVTGWGAGAQPLTAPGLEPRSWGQGAPRGADHCAWQWDPHNRWCLQQGHPASWKPTMLDTRPDGDIAGTKPSPQTPCLGFRMEPQRPPGTSPNAGLARPHLCGRPPPAFPAVPTWPGSLAADRPSFSGQQPCGPSWLLAPCSRLLPGVTGGGDSSHWGRGWNWQRAASPVKGMNGQPDGWAGE